MRQNRTTFFMSQTTFKDGTLSFQPYSMLDSPRGGSGKYCLLSAETHAMQPDGSFVGGFVGGAGTSFSGVSVVTGEFLARMKLSLLIDDRPYAGLVIPELG